MCMLVQEQMLFFLSHGAKAVVEQCNIFRQMDFRASDICAEVMVFYPLYLTKYFDIGRISQVKFYL